MSNSGRTSTYYLEEILSLESVQAVAVIGRDGFVIESVGGARAIELDAIGASVAGAIMRIETMGTELEIKKYKDMFVEYGKAMAENRGNAPAENATLTVSMVVDPGGPGEAPGGTEPGDRSGEPKTQSRLRRRHYHHSVVL